MQLNWWHLSVFFIPFFLYIYIFDIIRGSNRIPESPLIVHCKLWMFVGVAFNSKYTFFHLCISHIFILCDRNTNAIVKINIFVWTRWKKKEKKTSIVVYWFVLEFYGCAATNSKEVLSPKTLIKSIPNCDAIEFEIWVIKGAHWMRSELKWIPKRWKKTNNNNETVFEKRHERSWMSSHPSNRPRHAFYGDCRNKKLNFIFSWNCFSFKILKLEQKKS